jgi:uncharacterized protein YgiM (DUF1202 family)
MMRMRFFAAAALLLAACSALPAAPKQMSVTVQQTQVRDKASYLGKILGVLAYGDRVTILDQPAAAPKGWLKVQGPDGRLQGWVNASALTEKQIALKAGSQNVESSASSGEVYAEARAINPSVRVLFMSGYPADIIKTHVVPAERLHFLSKPAAPQVLLRKIREVLGK